MDAVRPSRARGARCLAAVSALIVAATAGCAPDVAAPAPSGRLTLVAAVDDPARPRNAAWSLDLAAGRSEALWEADAEIADLVPRPDGGAVLYREVWHYVPKTEALVVRALVSGAAPRYVVMGEPELRRLAGQVWAPDGRAVGYGTQAEAAERDGGGGAAARWEMRLVEPDGADPPSTDRRLFALDAAAVGSNALTLTAWLPARARAAVLEVPADGGPIAAVRIYDTATGRLEARQALGGGDPLVAPSPDGRRVAWLDAAVGVGIVDVATGDRRVVVPPSPDLAAGVPLALSWSVDGRHLAWAVAPPLDGPGADGGLRLGAWRFGGWPLGRRSAARAAIGEALGLLAVAPDGRQALALGGEHDDAPGGWWLSLDGRRAPRRLPLPAVPWAMAWWGR